MNGVSVVSVLRAGKNSIPEAIAKTLELCGPLHLSRNAKIVIKLNLCALRTPETGIVSDPRVVEALMIFLIDKYKASNITLVESDATVTNADLLFEWLGYSDLARKLNCRVKNLSKDELISVDSSRLSFCDFKIPKTVAESDCFISLAKMKTCVLTKISCCLKNQFGCIPNWRKEVYHDRINEVIALANKVMPPDLCLVDGIIAHEGTLGPSAGKPKYMGLLVGGKDPVAVDSTCARIMGFNPRHVNHIQKAKRLGIGIDNPQVVGENIKEVRSKFRFSLLESFLLNNVMSIRRRQVSWS